MAKKVRLLIGALSAEKMAERQQACLRTWFAQGQAHPDVDCVFLVGGSSQAVHRDGPHLRIPVVDDYQHLPSKTHAFCRWALDNYEFDYLFKCDDDTYIVLDRLLTYPIGQDLVGHDNGGWCSGGAGYLLSRRAAEAVATRMTGKTGFEDVMAATAVKEAGYPLLDDQRFRPWLGQWPTPQNDFITGHYANLATMLRLHEAFQQGS